MKDNKPIQKTTERNLKDQYAFNKIPANMLLGLATATTCSALAVKLLKKSELALLMALMAIPITLVCLNKKHSSQCKY